MGQKVVKMAFLWISTIHFFSLLDNAHLKKKVSNPNNAFENFRKKGIFLNFDLIKKGQDDIFKENHDILFFLSFNSLSKNIRLDFVSWKKIFFYIWENNPPTAKEKKVLVALRAIIPNYPISPRYCIWEKMAKKFEQKRSNCRFV